MQLRKELEDTKAENYCMAARIKILEDEQEMSKPLLKIGISVQKRIMLRCKQRSLQFAWNDPLHSEDLDILEKGNRAAHQLDINAITALFRLRILEFSNLPFEAVFKNFTPLHHLHVSAIVKHSRSLSLTREMLKVFGNVQSLQELQIEPFNSPESATRFRELIVMFDYKV